MFQPRPIARATFHRSGPEIDSALCDVSKSWLTMSLSEGLKSVFDLTLELLLAVPV